MLYIILARLGQFTGQCDRPGVRLSVTLVLRLKIVKLFSRSGGLIILVF